MNRLNENQSEMLDFNGVDRTKPFYCNVYMNEQYGALAQNNPKSTREQSMAVADRSRKSINSRIRVTLK